MHRRRFPPPAPAFDALEPRRLLTVVNATEGPDDIRVAFVGQQGQYEVRINGVGTYYARDLLELNTLGGNDTVRLISLGDFNYSNQSFRLNLGGGDDLVTNVNPTYGTGDFALLKLPVQIDAGSGNDTLALDSTGGSATTPVQVTLSNAAFGMFGVHVWQFGASRQGNLSYDADLENLDVVLGDTNDEVSGITKPPTLGVTINAQGGRDEFTIGGGDLDSRGWVNTTLLGGAGNDPIVFDDEDDEYAPATETETLSVDNAVVTKGPGARVVYSGFSAQEFRAANGSAGAPPRGGQIDFNAFQGSIVVTNVFVGANREHVINVGAGDVGSLAGHFNLLFGDAGDPASGSVNVNDQNAASARTWKFRSGNLFYPLSVTFNGAQPLNLRGGNGNDTFLIDAVSAGTSLSVRGGGGDDTFVLGDGDVDANLLAPVSVFGDAGFGDVVEFHNEAKALPAEQVLNGNNFTDGGRSHLLSGVEGVRAFQPAAAGSALTVRSTTAAVRVVGGAGPDAVLFGGPGSLLAAALRANATFDGGGGDDRLTLDDRASTSPGTFVFEAGERLRVGPSTSNPGVTTTGVELRTLLTGRSADTVTVNATASAVDIDTGEGNDTITVPDATGVVTVDTGPEAATVNSGDVLSVNADYATAGDAPATINLAKNDKVHSLFVRPQGTLRIPDGAALLVAHDVTLQGAVDLADGALILDGAAAPTPAAATAWLKTGRAGGTWDGTSPTGAGAVNSSLAAAGSHSDGVGLARASDLFGAFPATFAGHPVTAAAILMRYALAGDVTLDGAVDFADLVVLAQNYNGAGKFYFQGDTNFDDQTDFNDLVALAQNYNTALPAAVPAAAATAARRDATPVFADAPPARPERRPPPVRRT